MSVLHSVLAIILGLILSNQASALDCRNSEAVIYFGNGMFNSRAAAISSRRDLKESLEQNLLLPSGHREIGLAYNLN